MKGLRNHGLLETRVRRGTTDQERYDKSTTDNKNWAGRVQEKNEREKQNIMPIITIFQAARLE